MGALDGIRVLSFNHFLSGPAAAQHLGDLGADVIAVEPLTGAFQRNWAVANRYVDDTSVNHITTGRNKRSIAIDLKSPEGIAVAKHLIAGTDVLMENFRPGTLDKLGLSETEMRKVNPRIIYATSDGHVMISMSTPPDLARALDLPEFLELTEKDGFDRRAEISSKVREGMAVDHSTINRWVLAYAPLIEKRLRRFRKPHCGSIRIDETYVRIKGQWRYLYRAIDKHGNPVGFLLTAKRNLNAAKRFFRKMLKDAPLLSPGKIGTDGAGTFPPTIGDAVDGGLLASDPVHYVTKHLQPKPLAARCLHPRSLLQRKTAARPTGTT
ncbi:DDE superfamily endonuclease [Roseibium marinum]|uniref:DDE superfamily endonuclease n=1 Tax=Roseibium marinum TaxID=281252 RepID=A0A2S3UJB5_9HYPH|nr:DDE superfamily endonuclease [Roseibium marinum]